MIFTDKNGFPFEVRPYSPELHPFLEEMYTLFTPKAKFQGLPPLEADESGKWIRLLVDKGENFLALREGKVIGHAVLLPDFENKNSDFQIFVDQPNREIGVGSALMQEAIMTARRWGLEKIILTVDSYNYRAIWLYRKFLFTFSEAGQVEFERMMVLEL